jgi:broad specificity phosphatase PhoE
VHGAGFDQVFLARHGQTEWNRLGRRQGQLDSPLTALGERQADSLARTVAGLPGIDGVFSSPLGRAAMTAARCAQVLGLAVTVVQELAEVHHGAMAGLTASEIEARFPGAMNRRQQDKYQWRFPGGESYADASRRAAGALAQIAGYRSRRPLIVSHEMIGRMLIRHLLAASPATALSWSHPHDVLYQIDPRQQACTAIRVPPGAPPIRHPPSGAGPAGITRPPLRTAIGVVPPHAYRTILLMHRARPINRPGPTCRTAATVGHQRSDR